MTHPTGEPFGRPRLYPFGHLKIGEHFDVKLRSSGHRISIASCANQYARRYGGRFRTVMIRKDALGADLNRQTRGTATHVRVTRIA